MPTIWESNEQRWLHNHQSNTMLAELMQHEKSVADPEKLDAAIEGAINLIVLAGFDGHDSDEYGIEMMDTVQTLLTIAMIRCPQLADRLNRVADDGMVIDVVQE